MGDPPKKATTKAKQVLSEVQNQAKKLASEGMGVRAIAREIGKSPATISNWLKAS